MAEPARTITAEAWTDFWADEGPRSRCLANAPGLSGPLDEHWRTFAALLLPNTRIIDLGCGAGAACRAMLAGQASLHLTGIDIAQVPTSADRGMTLLSGVPMEALPFPDRAFGAAVSQFGYEYGKAELAAKELARVLVRGAPFSFLVHHPDGPIVAGMRRHRRAIEGLCGLRVQAAFFSGNADALAERIRDLERECSNDPIVESARIGLHAHIRDDQFHRLQIWKAITEALAPELFMLDSLDLCCGDEQALHEHMEPLTRWFDVRLPAILRSSDGEPIAWEVHATRLD